MATINLGKVRITFGGSFDNTKSYDILTIVDNPYKVKYISIAVSPVGTSLADNTIWTPLSGYFVEQYQGSSSTEPTARIDGSTLLNGDVFFNDTTNLLGVYNGTLWEYAATTKVATEISIAMSIALG